MPALNINFDKPLDALYQLGRRICTEIERIQPEIVIGLAHSGWMPVVVAQALWAESHTTPFPLTVRTNIGHEKYEFYRARFKPPAPAYCCSACGSGADRLGHYLAWASSQQPWLDVLRQQIEAVYQTTPARVLVVDDLFGGHRTCYLALGLLEQLYPQAQACMVAGNVDLTDSFVTAWLLQFIPELGNEVAQLVASKAWKRYLSPWHEDLKPLITGSEDIAPESLDWQPFGPDSPAVQKLAGLAALETILAAPAWAATLACRYALQREQGKIGAGEVASVEKDYIFQAKALEIEPAERLFRQAWLNSGITHQEIAQVYGDLSGGLEQIRKLAQPHGRGRGVVYMPEESTESWITAYLPPDRQKLDHGGFLIRGFFEFIPGQQLWAGAYPHCEYSLQLKTCVARVEFFKDLLAQGARRFIDLTVPGEFRSREPYPEVLAQAGQELGVSTERISFPLRFRAAPTRKQILALLQMIDEKLSRGQGIYLHAGHNLEGRVPLVLACMLIDQGQSPQQALAQVTDFWLQTLPYLIRLPLTERQRQFVLRW